MSRSEHGNARDRNDPRDRARKRHIKELIRAERRPIDPRLPVVSSAAIPIEVVDTGRFVHYPASVDDLRGVMARLPDGCLNGIAAIELRLTPLDPTAERDAPLDPFVGRLEAETIAGVYQPRLLGRYHGDGGRIQLFAYVYDPDLAERPIIELYLRMTMLLTFVHELGHHLDFSTRETRGRWPADIATEVEDRADAIEREWLKAYVIPYLEDRYPAELAELERWLERHVGVVLPLDLLVRGPGLFDPCTGFEALVSAVLAGAPRFEVLRDLAFRLHYDYHFELALALLDRLLAEQPDHFEAQSDRAHVLVHLERLDEADQIAVGLLARDPEDRASLLVRCQRALHHGDWTTVLATTTRRLELDAAGPGSRPRWPQLAARAAALIELGQWSDAERDLAELGEITTTDDGRDHVQTLTCLWHLRQQHYPEALALADTVAGDEAPDPRRLAARLEASWQLGQQPDDVEVSALLGELRTSGHAAWAERLAQAAPSARSPG